MEKLYEINETLSAIVWSDGMLILIIGVGIFFSVRLGFMQIFKFPKILRRTIFSAFKKKDSSNPRDKKSISQFAAMSAALAATMGTGNIVGVATALTLGGPGAIFWMWVSALFGMMTVYAENVLGMLYRYKNKNGEWVGGPMVYIERGLGCKPLGVFYAGACVLASFGIGNMTQSNSIASALNESFGMSPSLCGLIFSVLVAVILLGGLKRITSVTEKVIPIVSIVYILGAILIIVLNYKAIPSVFTDIFKSAFGFNALAGGVCGAAVKQAISVGFRRGVFSNEAGLGSTVLVHVSAENTTPKQQGMWGIFEVFVDTILCCTLTALALLTSGAAGCKGGSLDGAAMVIQAFSSGFGRYAGAFISICIAIFAFATLLGWSCFGAKTAEYLFGSKGASIYRMIFVAAIFIGATTELKLVWGISDTLNGIMAVPNLIALILLSKEVIKHKE